MERFHRGRNLIINTQVWSGHYGKQPQLLQKVSQFISSVADISKPSQTSDVLLDQHLMILKINFVPLNNEHSL